MKILNYKTTRVVAAAIIAAIFVAMTYQYPEGLRFIRLTQWFGLSALVLLYLYLLLDILRCSLSRFFVLPFIVFVLLHFLTAFFGEIGGLTGLMFLPAAFLVGALIGAMCLFTLFVSIGLQHLEALSSKKRRILKTITHIFGLLIVVHVLIIGTHYESYTGLVLRLSFVLVSILFVLECFSLDRFVGRKVKRVQMPLFTVFSTILVAAIGSRLFTVNPSAFLPTISMHGSEMMDNQSMDMSGAGNQVSPMVAMLNAMPTMRGDRTKRYTVSFDHSDTIKTNTDTLLSFTVFDAASGNQVGLFQLAYTKLMHMVIVDDELHYFTHIHPSQNGQSFIISTQFPHEGRYHIYISFQPLGAIEQQFGFTVLVGPKDQEIHQTIWQADDNLSKTFGEIQVTLTDPQLVSSKMAKGEQTLRFTLTNKNTGEPVTNLAPYLAAFGHLVMINTQTFEYLHVHPTNTVAPLQQDRSGPVVDFVPISVFDPIHPGIYRLFAQFNPDGKLFTSDFTIKVE